jgi:cell division protein ZapA (FtsZ GTPase activity inhibitor)
MLGRLILVKVKEKLMDTEREFEREVRKMKEKMEQADEKSNEKIKLIEKERDTFKQV